MWLCSVGGVSDGGCGHAVREGWSRMECVAFVGGARNGMWEGPGSKGVGGPGMEGVGGARDGVGGARDGGCGRVYVASLYKAIRNYLSWGNPRVSQPLYQSLKCISY